MKSNTDKHSNILLAGTLTFLNPLTLKTLQTRYTLTKRLPAIPVSDKWNIHNLRTHLAGVAWPTKRKVLKVNVHPNKMYSMQKMG
mmetsp:Transcript_36180/g.47722  ORF Transcript_36180/g.47722 Transcript_36180/m.47722 type:complete len:85 (+) Transcript_36180:802-1056(+)